MTEQLVSLTPRMARTFAQCAAMTKYSNHHHPMGAVIVKNGNVVSKGWNSLKTHPMQAKFKSRLDRIFLHAEIHAMVRARHDIAGADMYVVRTRKGGMLSSSRACRGCFNAMLEAGIRNVYYIDDADQFACEAVVPETIFEHQV